MSGEIFYTDEFGEWFADLSTDDQDAVAHLVELLAQKWLVLGHPYSSEIKGSRYALRELRSQKRKPIRVVYAFSPERNAVLLIGGDKTGNPRFYDEIIPRAETIWERYLRERTFFEDARRDRRWTCLILSRQIRGDALTTQGRRPRSRPSTFARCAKRQARHRPRSLSWWISTRARCRDSKTVSIIGCQR